MKTTVRTACVPAEILTTHLSTTGQERYLLCRLNVVLEIKF
jgi:hypothetical protein